MNEGEILRTLDGLPTDRRTIVAVAGPPGSGKSTFASKATDYLNASEPGRAEILPMDGFHYDNRVLEETGRLPNKGAPDTFDVDGLEVMLCRLKENFSGRVAIPVFDRDLEVARAGARLIGHSTRVVMVEGNYLLCNVDPWSRLQQHFDLTIMIEVPEDVLRERLRARWVSYGLDEDAILWKLDGNDLPNGRFVKKHSNRPRFTFRQGH